MNEVPRRAEVSPDVVGNVLARSEIVDELTLTDVIQKLRRQKIWILGTIFVVTFFSWIGIQQLTPLYTAVTQVMIGLREENVIDVQDVLSGVTPEGVMVENEVHVIRSLGIVGKTVDELGLKHDPEFNPALRPPSALRRMFNLRELVPESWQTYLPAPSKRQELTKEEREAVEREIVIDQFLTHLTATPDGESLVIMIEFTSRAPRTAQLAINTLTDFYVVSQLDAKLAAAERASTWLSDRLERLRADAQASAKAVETFRRNNDLLRANETTTLAEQEISGFNMRYVDQQMELAEAEARLRQVERLLESEVSVETASEVLNSSMVSSLRRKEVELESTAAELAQVYGEQHPTMVNLRAELNDLKQNIRLEVRKVIQSLRNDVSIARTRTQSLGRVLEQRRQALANMNASEVQLGALQREAEANQNLLATVLTRFKEVSAQEDFQKADAMILARAGLPRGPSFPNEPLLLSLAVVCSICLGILIAFAVDQSDSGLRSMEQVEKLMGIVPLGLIPALNEIGQIGQKPTKYILKHPNSAYSDSIRTLYANLAYTAGDGPAKTLLITSSVPKEGKTTIAVSLTRSLASFGQNVLLLDCDFRRGATHEGLGVPQKPGLADYLAGTATLEAVMRRDSETGAHFIPVGTYSTKPLGFQAYNKLETLLGDFANSGDYHLIILDSAPILAVSETGMLAKVVDEALLVVHWAKTRREQVKRALKQVEGSGCKVSGIVLSMVDVKRHSQYGFGDSGLYTGDMRRYYTNR
jgi:capsular exopolysaccharide synthesis family protein